MSEPEESAGSSSDALLSNPEAVMRVWFRYNQRDFLQLIVHETKQEIFIIETFLKVFLDDPNLLNLPVNSTWGQKTVRENCGAIMRQLAKLKQIMAIAWEYSEIQKDTDSRPE